MKAHTSEELKAFSLQVAERLPYLKLLVLFGSRATGKTHTESDWDFAALYDEELRKFHIKDAWDWFEVSLIISQTFAIPDLKIDMAELNHCSPLLGYHVARDGKLLYERSAGEFLKFQCKAWKMYADTAKFRQAQRQAIELALQKFGV